MIEEKCLHRNDRFSNLLVQKNIFSERMLDDNMEDESLALNYCIMLMSRSQNAFTQFIGMLIETKQKDILDLLLNTTSEIQCSSKTVSK